VGAGCGGRVRGGKMWSKRPLLRIVLKLHKYLLRFMISNFRLVPNVVFFLLDESPASEFYLPTFRNTLSIPSS